MGFFVFISTVSIADFKIGKLFKNDTLAVYGTVTPVALYSNLILGGDSVNIIATTAGSLGGGVSYKIAPKVSVFGEIRAFMGYPGFGITIASHKRAGERLKFTKGVNFKEEFVLGLRVIAGVSFHASSING